MRVRLDVTVECDPGTRPKAVRDEVQSNLDSVDYVRSARVEVLRGQVRKPAKPAVPRSN